MKEMSIDTIHEVLRRKYVDFENPQYHFTQNNEEEKVANQVLADIKKIYTCDIISDSNYDTSLIITVLSETLYAILYLSFLDRIYYIEYDDKSLTSGIDLKSIYDILNSYFYYFVPEAILFSKSPVKMELAQSNSTMFNSLFSDRYSDGMT